LRSLDVAIVGAGAAGIGMALALAKVPGLRTGVLEAGRVGETFRRWPAQTRLITPSFHSTPFGLADLNAVNEASSPALHAGVEHLSGAQYADYLAFLTQAHALPVVENCRVENVKPVAANTTEETPAGFILTTGQSANLVLQDEVKRGSVHLEPEAPLTGGGEAPSVRSEFFTTRHGQLHARFLIWACGEYQFPDLTPFPGAGYCPHYAQVATWADFRGSHYTVIGGFESGADAAVQLTRLGRKVRLLVRKTSWDPKGVYDPSLALSPYTRGRLYDAVDTGRLEIVFGVDVMAVTKNPNPPNAKKRWRIHAADGRFWDDVHPPILGTGFVKGGGARQIASLWDWDDDGRLLLSDLDESTRAPGLFLVGPQVRQGTPDAPRIYCFIYKFRQRFAFIAERIAERLELDARALRVGDGAWGPFGNSDCCEGCQC